MAIIETTLAISDNTLLDGYNLPNLSHFTGKIQGSTVFSKIDLVKAFHQIPLDAESQEKTTILTPWGAWRFKRLAMGLKNSAQSFQRLMDSVLAGVDNVFVYMDDILVYAKDQKSHLETVETVIKRLESAGLAISPGKCIFGVQQLEYVGYTVNREGIEPLKRKLDSITSFPPP